MSQIKIKQIKGGVENANKVLAVDDTGATVWTTVAGDNSVLGEPTDGSLTDPRYSGGNPPAAALTETTKVVDAIDSMNEILGLLLPAAPASISTKSISFSGLSLAYPTTDITNNTPYSLPSPTGQIRRSIAATVTSDNITSSGNGMEGVLSLYANGSSIQSHTFTEATGETSTGALTVSNNKWTVPAGFHQTFDTRIINAPVQEGYNTFQLRHSISGDTAIVGVIRDTTVQPGAFTLTATAGTENITYSSGIPHYRENSTINLTSTEMSYLTTMVWTSSPITITGPGSTISSSAIMGAGPYVKNLSYTMTNVPFTIGGAIHGNSSIVATAANSNGSTTSTVSNILVKTTSVQSGKIYEEGFPAKSVTATRFTLLSGDNSVDTPATGSWTSWNSTWNLASPSNLHEAAIVGGVLKCDQTDYRTYLPAGPDLSSKPSTQYAVFSFAVANVSNMTINVTGTYSGCWITLPMVSDNGAISPNSLNGWWNAMAAYNGSGVPGRVGDTTAGCGTGTISTGSGNMLVTFGTQSSSNSAGNRIYIRFKLTAGQSITALSIS